MKLLRRIFSFSPIGPILQNLQDFLVKRLEAIAEAREISSRLVDGQLATRFDLDHSSGRITKAFPAILLSFDLNSGSGAWIFLILEAILGL